MKMKCPTQTPVIIKYPTKLLLAPLQNPLLFVITFHSNRKMFDFMNLHRSIYKNT